MKRKPGAILVKISRVIMCFILALPITGFAALIHVQPGATIDMGGGTMDAGCADANIEGTLNLQSGSILAVQDFDISGAVDASDVGLIELSGNWLNGGTFIAGMSMVRIQDGTQPECQIAVSLMTGNTDFYDFVTESENGKELQPAAGSTQTFSNSLTLRGSNDGLVPLLIRSSSPGNDAYFSLDPAGLQDIYAVDVRDNNASGGQVLVPTVPEAADSIDSGNTPNWFVEDQPAGPATPVPSLPMWTLLLLIIAIMTVELRRRRNFLNQGKRQL